MRAAIGFAQRVEQLAQRHRFFAEERVAGVEHRFLVGVLEIVERGFEFGNLGALGALERVEVGPALTHVAVGGDQLLHSRRACGPYRNRRRGHHHPGAALLGTLGKGVDDRQVGHVAGIAAIDCGHMLQGIEIIAPIVGHTAGVGQVVFVHFLDIRRIAAEEVGVALIGLVDGRCLVHIPLAFRFPPGKH